VSGQAGVEDPQISEVAAHNRALWDRRAADYQERHGPQLAASGGSAWGVWQLPESELCVLGEVDGRDVLELGCGAAQWAIALARRGARVTGLDNSGRQLKHARGAMAAAGIELPLVHASAEATGLEDASFDIVFCDHGAMSFADPTRTVPEAARLLRPGGLLAFCMNTPIIELAWPVEDEHPGERLVLDYWEGLKVCEEPDGPVSYQLPYGEWIRLFGENGLLIEELLELRPPPEATSSYRDDADRAWARRWPMEHIWRLRRAPPADAQD
jgi:SAM-dependent methyltransferase